MVRSNWGGNHRNIQPAARKATPLEERAMSFLNWEDTLHFDPHDPLNAFATHGIPVPTYGNYGGPGYSAGELGGPTPEPFQLTAATQPVDQLDALFYQHDLVHQHFSDGTATFADIVAADVG